jgi:hypothetical protein
MSQQQKMNSQVSKPKLQPKDVDLWLIEEAAGVKNERNAATVGHVAPSTQVCLETSCSVASMNCSVIAV